MVYVESFKIIQSTSITPYTDVLFVFLFCPSVNRFLFMYLSIFPSTFTMTLYWCICYFVCMFKSCKYCNIKPQMHSSILASNSQRYEHTFLTFYFIINLLLMAFIPFSIWKIVFIRKL